MTQKLKKAVFPVAGMGSRFLPATKANPKEMLPIVDKPLIQHAVEEAINAGLTEMIFITSSSKRSIEDHFDSNYELEKKLLERGKIDLYHIVSAIAPKNINFTYVRQQEALGLGHAILCAKHIIGDEPFAVLLADDLIEDNLNPCLSAMVDAYANTHTSVVAVQAVPREQLHRYGIIGIKDHTAQLAKINTIVEKPVAELAPSNLAAVGRYIFTPDIFACLEQVDKDANGEIQLTDAIAFLLKQQEVNAFVFHGNRYDCGSKLGYVKATVEYALRHPELGQEFQTYLNDIIKKLSPISIKETAKI